MCNSTIMCERHKLYCKENKTREEDNLLKLGGLGPIVEEKQVRTVIR